MCNIYVKAAAGMSKEDIFKYRAEQHKLLEGIKAHPEHPTQTYVYQMPPKAQKKRHLEKDEKEAAKAAKKRRVRDDPSSSPEDSSSSEDSDSDDSASPQGKGAPPEAKKRAGPPMTPPGGPGQQADKKPRVVLDPYLANREPPPRPDKPIRACAKMLCRSRLRCPCHFMPSSECERFAKQGLHFDRPRPTAQQEKKVDLKVTDVVVPEPSSTAEWAKRQDELFPGKSKLPANWIQIRSKSQNNVYFYNTKSGDSSFEEPTA